MSPHGPAATVSPAAPAPGLPALAFDAPNAGLQRLVAYGCPANASRQGLLHVRDGAQARRWLGQVLALGWLSLAAPGSHELPVDDSGQVLGAASGGGAGGAGGSERRDTVTLSLGLSQRGLQALGLAPPLLTVLRELAPAFAQGAALRAARALGDTGDSASPLWAQGFEAGRALLLVTLHADEPAALCSRWAVLRQLDGASGLTGWDDAVHDAAHLTPAPRRQVHFGYRDGMSNPRIAGLHRATGSASAPVPGHATGEMLLGYPTDDGNNPWWLGGQPLAAGFFRNASFGALRKVAQNEPAFRAFVGRSACEQGVDRAWIMAKLCGRWPDGQLIIPDGVAAPEGALPDSLLADGSRPPPFSFAHDPRGEGCPFGAHIRRMNPRDDGLAQRRQRPLMRRGMPYGPAYDIEPDAARGLLGLFFCASLEDQFEHLLGEWVNKNPMGPDNRGQAKDPLIGQHDQPASTLHLPATAPAAARRLGGFTPFVTTLGTAYLLFLSAPALQALADGLAGVVIAPTGTKTPALRCARKHSVNP